GPCLASLNAHSTPTASPCRRKTPAYACVHDPHTMECRRIHAMPRAHHPLCTRCRAMLRRGREWARLGLLVGEARAPVPWACTGPWPSVTVCGQCLEAIVRGLSPAGDPDQVEAAPPRVRPPPQRWR